MPPDVDRSRHQKDADETSGQNEWFEETPETVYHHLTRVKVELLDTPPAQSQALTRREIEHDEL